MLHSLPVCSKVTPTTLSGIQEHILLRENYCIDKLLFILFVDMTQASCECIILALLNKKSIRDVSLLKDLAPLKNKFSMSLLRGQDKTTHVRAIAKVLYDDGYITIKEGASIENLSMEDIAVVKSL